MTQLRLLAYSFIAAAIVLPAGAQKPAATNPLPLAATITTPSILTLNTNPSPGTYTFKSGDAPSATITAGKPFVISKSAQKALTLHKNGLEMAQASSPCLKLRTYNFTARDLKSPNPHASSEHDCTPLSSVHLLQGPATAAPAIPGHAQLEPQATITPR